MSSLYGYGSSDKMEQVNERLTRLEETMEKLYKPSSAIVYSKEVLHQRMKYDESNGTDIFDQSLLLRILQRS